MKLNEESQRNAGNYYVYQHMCNQEEWEKMTRKISEQMMAKKLNKVGEKYWYAHPTSSTESKQNTHKEIHTYTHHNQTAQSQCPK